MSLVPPIFKFPRTRPVELLYMYSIFYWNLEISANIPPLIQTNLIAFHLFAHLTKFLLKKDTKMLKTLSTTNRLCCTISSSPPHITSPRLLHHHLHHHLPARITSFSTPRPFHSTLYGYRQQCKMSASTSKKEFLCILPDRSGVVEKRMEVRGLVFLSLLYFGIYLSEIGI